MNLRNSVNAVALGAISAVFTFDSFLDVIQGKPVDSVLSGAVAALAGNAAKEQFDEAQASSSDDDRPITNGASAPTAP